MTVLLTSCVHFAALFTASVMLVVSPSCTFIFRNSEAPEEEEENIAVDDDDKEGRRRRRRVVEQRDLHE